MTRHFAVPGTTEQSRLISQQSFSTIALSFPVSPKFSRYFI
jgi:hypothetical protein